MLDEVLYFAVILSFRIWVKLFLVDGMRIDGSEKVFIDGIEHKLWLSSVLEVALINNLSL